MILWRCLASCLFLDEPQVNLRHDFRLMLLEASRIDESNEGFLVELC